jgi:DNA-binding IclR family transcriptional regulator
LSSRQRYGRDHGQSQSAGLHLVTCLALAGRAQTLKDLAAAAGMSPSKAHRYLVSLKRAGLVEQIEPLGLYELGPMAVTLGLAALGRTDLHRLAWQELVRLSGSLGLTAVQGIWADDVPVVVRAEQPQGLVTVNVRTGGVLGLLSTASGRVFAAFRPETEMKPIIDREFARGAQPRHMGKMLDRAGFDALLDDIRRRHMARTEGDDNLAIDALSGAVFNHVGALVAVIALVGTSGSFDLRWDGPVARALGEACRGLSRRLGHDQPKPEEESPVPKRRSAGGVRS